MKRLFRSVVFPAALLLCQLAAAQNVHTIYLVRHAEQVAGGTDPALSPAGEKRADCLAKMLRDAGIKQIFVTDAKRAQQTAAPLAAALKVTPSVLPAKDPNSLIRDLTYAGPGNILVVGHSNTLPFVLARLKAGTVPEIAETEYDRMFVVTVTEGSATPVSTLRYCNCEAAAPPAKPKASPKPATKKTPAKKS